MFQTSHLRSFSSFRILQTRTSASQSSITYFPTSVSSLILFFNMVVNPSLSFPPLSSLFSPFSTFLVSFSLSDFYSSSVSAMVEEKIGMHSLFSLFYLVLPPTFSFSCHEANKVLECKSQKNEKASLIPPQSSQFLLNRTECLANLAVPSRTQGDQVLAWKMPWNVS